MNQSNLTQLNNQLEELNQYDYLLPNQLIAQYPLKKRTDSKMMHCHHHKIEHQSIQNFPNLLKKNDLLIINTSKTIKARFWAKRLTGAKVQILFQSQINQNQFLAATKSNRPIKIGDEFILESSANSNSLKQTPHLKAIQKQTNGNIEFQSTLDIETLINQFGVIPLPPYIDRKAEKLDDERYQNIYAKNGQSIACPTAGLHFSDDLLNQIKNKGVQVVDISLDVGSATFKPVTTKNINHHQMHFENYQISEKNAEIINQTLFNKKSNSNSNQARIIAIGSTSTRALESNFLAQQKIQSGKFNTNLFIKPGFEFKVIDAMLTNFHIPKSTLVIMVASFMGYDYWKKAYQEAIDNHYRFLSYGDCMLIER